MTRTTLIALAVAGLTFAAAPSYAQSSYGGNTGASYDNSADRTADKAERKAKRAAKKAEKARRKAEKERIKLAQMKEDEKKSHSSATDAKEMKEHSSLLRN